MSDVVARQTATSKNLQRLGYRRIVQLLVYLIIVPTVMLLSLGIVLMFLGEARIQLILGILTVSLVAAMITGVILVLVFLQREANLSELQADFVSKVSHELRTPLTAIRLFAETIERSRGDEATMDKCLGLLIEECGRLTIRIERLLDWGRMEAGRKLYDLRPEDLKEVLTEAVETFAPARYPEVTLVEEVERGLPPVLCDRHALVDAVANLLSNARKYGGEPPRIELRAHLKERFVQIEVRDNGGGIPRAEQRRIFDKFYRIDDRLSRTQEGSGLGLAIVKHVARAHDAHVEVESELGKGSIFRLLLRAGPGRS